MARSKAPIIRSNPRLSPVIVGKFTPAFGSSGCVVGLGEARAISPVVGVEVGADVGVTVGVAVTLEVGVVVGVIVGVGVGPSLGVGLGVGVEIVNASC